MIFHINFEYAILVLQQMRLLLVGSIQHILGLKNLILQRKQERLFRFHTIGVTVR